MVCATVFACRKKIHSGHMCAFASLYRLSHVYPNRYLIWRAVTRDLPTYPCRYIHTVAELRNMTMGTRVWPASAAEKLHQMMRSFILFARPILTPAH